MESVAFPDAALALAAHLTLPPRARLAFPRVQSRMVLWGIAGHGAVVVNGTRFFVERDTLMLMPWNHRIRYEAGEEGAFAVGGAHVIPFHGPGPITYHVSHSEDDEWADMSCRNDAFTPDIEGIRRSVAPANRPLRHLLEYAAQLMMRRPPQEDVLRFLGRRILAEVHDALVTTPAKPTDAPGPLRRVIAFVETHLPADLNLTLLALVGGTSVDTLIRHFKKHLGVTPKQWVLQQRLERAAYLLLTTNIKSREVGEEVGIPDPYYFSRVFKSHYGKPPSKFRKRGLLQ